MKILGIETSCDDCCIAIVEDGKRLIIERQYNQEQIHASFGGVVPEIAARAHVRTILPLFLQVIEESGCAREEIEAIAFTAEPGLHNSLLIGNMFGQAYAYARGIPAIGVNHLYAHLYAAQLEGEIAYPHLGIIVSGGHTLFGIVRAYNEYEVLGTTVDDACGEAFDKIAAHLGLGYPGGREIEERARQGKSEAAAFPDSNLNNARRDDAAADDGEARDRHRFDLSYSGLKTAVIHQRERFWNTDYPMTVENIAAAFQKSAIGRIVKRARALVEYSGISTIVCGGGVCANRMLARELTALPGVTCHIPAPQLCTDNAAMVAGIGYWYLCGSRPALCA